MFNKRLSLCAVNKKRFLSELVIAPFDPLKPWNSLDCYISNLQNIKNILFSFFQKVERYKKKLYSRSFFGYNLKIKKWNILCINIRNRGSGLFYEKKTCYYCLRPPFYSSIYIPNTELDPTLTTFILSNSWDLNFLVLFTLYTSEIDIF